METFRDWRMCVDLDRLAAPCGRALGAAGCGLAAAQGRSGRAGRLRLAWSLCRFYPLWGYEFKKKGEEGNEHISGKLWKFIFEISGDQF